MGPSFIQVWWVDSVATPHLLAACSPAGSIDPEATGNHSVASRHDACSAALQQMRHFAEGRPPMVGQPLPLVLPGTGVSSSVPEHMGWNGTLPPRFPSQSIST